MVRTFMLRALSGFERLLIFFGLLLVLLFAAVHVYRAIYSHALLREFWRNQVTSTTGAPVAPSFRNPGIPDFRFWSANRIEAYQVSLTATIPPPLGVLRIPDINLEVPVLEGTDDLTLNRAVGHIEHTAALGANGNAGIAGHRDGFFRALKDVHIGDTMDLYTEKGNSRYLVDEIVIVPPEDVSVLAPRSRPALTLVTCYPFYFVGNAPLRYVVSATTMDTNNLANSGQLRSPAEGREAGNSH